MIDWRANEGRERRKRANRQAWVVVAVSWVVIILAVALGVSMLMSS